MFARIAGRLRSLLPSQEPPSQPPPQQPPHAPPDEALLVHVRYAIALGQDYLQQIELTGADLDGLRVLELGPGSDFGPALILASHGARVTIADRFMYNQDAPHHRRLNQALLDAWTGPHAALRHAVEAGGYDGVLTLHTAGAEGLPCADDSFDVILSNAVFEHVVDLPAALRELYRVTAPGGVNAHQVDFRDHRDFDRPLEHLLSPTDDFEPASEWPGQFGTRLRPAEVGRMCREADFQVEAVDINGLAGNDYLDDFMPRLAASSSPYRGWSREDLAGVGARFWLRRRT